MSFLGRWEIDDLLTFSCNTHDAATGAATDADSVPSYRVYEDETGTAILNGSMAKLDDGNTTGFYSEQITLSAANGFEVGKAYSIYISATVDSITGTTHRTFQVEAALATQASVNTIDDLLDTEVAAIKTVVDAIQSKTDNLPSDPADASVITGRFDTVDSSISALNDLSAADVNAEVVDALNVDTYAEPGQGTPGATVSLATKINYLYKAWRNRNTQTADTYSLYNDDATTVGQKATTSDNGTTFDRSEITSGP